MIRAEGLTMHYGPVVALKNVSFEVKQGEIVGLLGPNGAGKSTAMKILTTYLHPTRGTAQVNDIDVLKDPVGVRKIIGYLPEILPLYMDMDVRDYLKFVGKARGLRGAELLRRTDIVVEEVGLKAMYRKIVRELSKGFKQRTGLAQALIHDPNVIILDEPTSGLDPHQIVEIRHLIRTLAEGRTVILSTHILQEVEASADRIIIINEGKIVADGTVDELRSQVGGDERTLISLEAKREDAEKALSGLSGVKRVDFSGETNGYLAFMLHGKPGSELWREAGALAKSSNWAVRELTDKPLTLEETFLSLTEREQGGAK